MAMNGEFGLTAPLPQVRHMHSGLPVDSTCVVMDSNGLTCVGGVPFTASSRFTTYGAEQGGIHETHG